MSGEEAKIERNGDDDDEDEKVREAAVAVAAREMNNLLDHSQIDQLKQLQLLILGRLQDSNALLSHLNDFSERSFSAVGSDFSKNTRMVKSMKADLDHIFRRIRSLKERLNKHYPNIFKQDITQSQPDGRPNLEKPQI